MADAADKLIDKFGPVLDSLELNSLKQASFLESIYQLTVVSDIEEARQISLLSRISDILQSQLDFDKEFQERRKTEEDLGDIPTPETSRPVGDESEPAVTAEPAKLGLAEMLTGALTAPFIFKFAKGFLQEVTDGLIELTAGGVTGIISGLQGRYNALTTAITGPLYKIFDSVTDSFKGLSNLNSNLANRFANIKSAFSAGLDSTSMIVRNVNGTFRSATLFDDVIRGIGAAFTPVVNILSKIGGFISTIGTKAAEIFSKIPGVTTLTGFIGKIAWPFTMIMGLFDGISEFRNTEGSMMEKILAGVGGFLGEIIGAPLDLLKGAVAWILDKLGFEKAAEILSSFGVEETIRSIFGGISDMISSVVTSIKEFFSWTGDIAVDGWNGLANFVSGIFGSVTDWFSEKLSFNLEDGDFSIQALFDTTIESIKTFFANLFDILPSLDEVKSTLTSMLPSWMQPEAIEEQRRNLQNEIETLQSQREQAPVRQDINGLQDIYTTTKEEIDAEINDLVNRLNSLPQASAGGILNMPESGGLAMLHGQEAVIPLDSPEGKSILGQKTAALSEQAAVMATQPAPVMIRGGDTMTPVNNNTNNSRTTIVNNVNDPTRKLSVVPF